MGFLDTLLFPFEWFVASILAGFEWLLTAAGMSDTSGWTWVLAIVGLVLVLRILLMPLFVRQIHSQRRMQMLQPEMMKIQQKYKGKKDEASRRAQSEEMFGLYRKHGANPFSSCLPILIQMPFFFALFRLLNTVPQVAEGARPARGFFTQELAQKMDQATIFGSQLSTTFLHDNDPVAKVLAVVLIVAMSATTFITQHQLMRKNMPAAALENNPMAQQQKIMLYALPVIFAVSGVNFPIGVLIYWTTTNLWTMAQQFYVIRSMPAPGSPAEQALQQRRLAKGKPVTSVQLRAEKEKEAAVQPVRVQGQRVQPTGKKRAKKNNRPKGR